jgi:dihydroorotate dehydrogenase
VKATLISRLDHRVRPWLAKSLPPQWFITAYSEGRTPYLKFLSEENIPAVVAPQRPVELWGLRFRNDISNAAGFDKDGTLLHFNHAIGAGFTVVGTVLNRTHSGNIFSSLGRTFNPWTPLPSSSSAINSLGLPGKGIDPVLDRIKAFQDDVQPADYPIGLSIMGHPSQKGQAKIDGVIECLEKALPIVDFIELNESCPNVQHDSPTEKSHHDFEHRIKHFTSCRNTVSPNTPLWVKFGQKPSNDSLCLLDRYGVQAVALLNTQTDYKSIRSRLPQTDHKLFDYYTKNYRGGVSGRVIQGDAAEAVEHTALAIESLKLKLKIVHVGGLNCKGDMDGSRQLAPLREWYTGLMENLGTQPPEKIYPSLF